jgi:hypothetical protein
VKPNILQLKFDGAMLTRGFWLYVWEIKVSDGRVVHYDGKTGDKASRVSQSPFNRLTNHMGDNKHSNALRRHLGQMKINLENCCFCFHAYGPLFGGRSQKTHGELCDVTSRLERALADALTAAGYEVINKVHCRTALDAEVFADIYTAFATHFDKLSAGDVGTSVRDVAALTTIDRGPR